LVIQRLGHLALRKPGDHVEHGGARGLSALVELFMQFPAIGIGHDVGRARQYIRDHAHAVRVISDSEEIIGGAQLDRLTCVGRHLFAARKTIRLPRHQPVAAAARIRGERRVHMHIAEVDIGWEAAIGIRRVASPRKRPCSGIWIYGVLRRCGSRQCCSDCEYGWETHALSS
jgi:hypothetical protein